MAKSKCTAFGMKVKMAMIEQGISGQELADRVGYTGSTISDVIYGRNDCAMTRALIAKELGISDEEVMDDLNEKII